MRINKDSKSFMKGLYRSRSVSHIPVSRSKTQDPKFLREHSARFPADLGFHRRESVGLLEKCVYLKGTDVFKHLEDEHVALVAEICRWESYAPGDRVYDEGEVATQLWIVIDGCIQSRASGINGTMYGPGSCLGEMSLIRGSIRIDMAVSVPRSDVFVFHANELTALAVRNPSVLHVLLSWLSARILNRMSDSDHVAAPSQSGRERLRFRTNTT